VVERSREKKINWKLAVLQQMMPILSSLSRQFQFTAAANDYEKMTRNVFL